MDMARSLLIPAIAIVIFLVSSVGPIATNNKALALPYNAVFSHGCTDAKIVDVSQRYVNQPETNVIHHTAEGISLS